MDNINKNSEGVGRKPTPSFFILVPGTPYYSYTIVKIKVKRFMGVYSILYYILLGGVVL